MLLGPHCMLIFADVSCLIQWQSKKIFLGKDMGHEAMLEGVEYGLRVYPILSRLECLDGGAS